MVLRETEILWGMADATHKTILFCPGLSGLAVLDKFGNIFDCYTIQSFTLSYKPAVGLNTSGKVWCGIDYTAVTDAKGDNDVTKVARLTPNFVTGAVRPARLVVPPGMANSRRLLKCSTSSSKGRADSIAFQILMGYDSATAPGLITVSYTVAFSGVSSDL